MEETIVCPLGSECTSIKENKIYRCAWHVKIAGVSPDGSNVDEWKCAMSWMPILQVEGAMTNRGQTSAIESLREETTKRQDTFNQILTTATSKQLGRS